MAAITEIKNNLVRISQTKTDIISAITAKGGIVASGAKIEDLPACIRAIPTGGGGGGGVALENVSVLVADFAETESLTVLSGAYYGTKQAIVS